MELMVRDMFAVLGGGSCHQPYIF
uniref:Uncharacterized protein n=1 Tax=Rhizophora mucronata TaxID=61149 RepID=A0A2P2IQT9_RHIMU